MAGIHAVLAGSGARLQVTVDITTNQTNYVFNTAKVPVYIPGQTDVVFNVASGVILSANSTAVYAGDVDTSWAAGDTVRINNSGTIVGMGGAGGAGGLLTNNLSGYAGENGGGAFRAQRSVSVSNTGTLAGGGGGGGGGAAARDTSPGETTATTGGGGGGGGRSSAAANSAGGAAGFQGGQVPLAGNPGTFSAAGSGGAGGISTPGVTQAYGGAGGAGGGWGAAGTAGQNATNDLLTTTGGAGGAAGAAVVGNSNITWIATGTRLGAIT